MNFQNLTIGQRIIAGFSLFVILTIALGSFSIYVMYEKSLGAAFLSEAVAPQADLAIKLSSATSELRYASRTYAETGDPAQWQDAQMHLADVESLIEQSQTLSKAQPALTLLRSQIDDATGALSSYKRLMDETRRIRTDLAEYLEQLNSAATSFVSNIDNLIDGQNLKLEAEINSGLEGVALQERRTKYLLANEILEAGNSIRVANFKTLATGDQSIVEAELPMFVKMDTAIQELRKLIRDKKDEADLNDVAEAKNSYKIGIENTLALGSESAKTAAQSQIVGEQLEEIIAELLDKSNSRTLSYATESTAALNFSVKMMVMGLITVTLICILAGYFINRSISSRLAETADTITSGSHQVAVASNQVSASSQSLALGASQQAAALEEVTSSVEELSATTQQNLSNAETGNKASAEARRAAEDGAREMVNMRNAMDAIQLSSKEISKIIETIDEIAFQTNILALNAAVEAARAGDAGAGFAVVAEEVRNLAQRSANAAQETSTKIEDASRRSEQGVAISSIVSKAFDQILDTTRTVDSLVADMTNASREQSVGLSQINKALSEMDQVTQASAANAEETASSSEELNAQSEELKNTADALAALVGIKSGNSYQKMDTELRASSPKTNGKKSEGMQFEVKRNNRVDAFFN